MSEPRDALLATQGFVDAVAAPGRSPVTALDDERLWLRPLNASGAEHEQAVGELHALLLRASAHEVRRRATAFGIAKTPSLTTSPSRPPPTRCLP